MMDITELGAWGEFLDGVSGLVAAIGVIATLVYLAIQIRLTRKVVLAQTFRAPSKDLQDLSMRLADSPTLSAITAKLYARGWPQDGAAFQELSPVEQEQYRVFLFAHLHRMTNLAQEYEDGLLSRAYYEQGIRGTIVTLMMLWKNAGVRQPIPPILHRVYDDALSVEASRHETRFLGGAARR